MMRQRLPPLTTSNPQPPIPQPSLMTTQSSNPPKQSLTINTSPIRSIAAPGQSGDFAKRNDLLKELLGGIINDYNVDELNNFDKELNSIIKSTTDDINENKKYLNKLETKLTELKEIDIQDTTQNDRKKSIIEKLNSEIQNAKTKIKELEAEEKARLEAEQKRKEEQEKAKKEAEEKAKKDAEEKARLEAIEKEKKEAEKARIAAEEKARLEAIEKEKKEAEKARIAAEEKARLEAEEARIAEQQRLEKEAAEKAALEAEKANKAAKKSAAEALQAAKQELQTAAEALQAAEQAAQAEQAAAAEQAEDYIDLNPEKDALNAAKEALKTITDELNAAKDAQPAQTEALTAKTAELTAKTAELTAKTNALTDKTNKLTAQIKARQEAIEKQEKEAEQKRKEAERKRKEAERKRKEAEERKRKEALEKATANKEAAIKIAKKLISNIENLNNKDPDNQTLTDAITNLNDAIKKLEAATETAAIIAQTAALTTQINTEIENQAKSLIKKITQLNDDLSNINFKDEQDDQLNEKKTEIETRLNDLIPSIERIPKKKNYPILNKIDFLNDRSNSIEKEELKIKTLKLLNDALILEKQQTQMQTETETETPTPTPTPTQTETETETQTETPTVIQQSITDLNQIYSNLNFNALTINNLNNLNNNSDDEQPQQQSPTTQPTIEDLKTQIEEQSKIIKDEQEALKKAKKAITDEIEQIKTEIANFITNESENTSISPIYIEHLSDKFLDIIPEPDSIPEEIDKLIELKFALESVLKTAKAEKAEEEERIANAEAEKAKAEAEKAKAVAEAARIAANDARIAAAAYAKEAVTEIIDKATNNSLLNHEIENLTKELALKEQEVASKEQELEKLKKENTDLNESISNNLESNNTLLDEFREKETKLKKLKDELEEIYKYSLKIALKLSQAFDDIDAKTEENKELTEENEELKKRLDDLKKKLEEAQIATQKAQIANQQLKEAQAKEEEANRRKLEAAQEALEALEAAQAAQAAPQADNTLNRQITEAANIFDLLQGPPPRIQPPPRIPDTITPLITEAATIFDLLQGPPPSTKPQSMLRSMASSVASSVASAASNLIPSRKTPAEKELDSFIKTAIDIMDILESTTKSTTKSKGIPTMISYKSSPYQPNILVLEDYPAINITNKYAIRDDIRLDPAFKNASNAVLEDKYKEKLEELAKQNKAQNSANKMKTTRIKIELNTAKNENEIKIEPEAVAPPKDASVQTGTEVGTGEKAVGTEAPGDGEAEANGTQTDAARTQTGAKNAAIQTVDVAADSKDLYHESKVEDEKNLKMHKYGYVTNTDTET